MERKYKILVAEDEELCSNLFRTYLERIGYEVVSARDGAEAWQLYEQEEPDLLLSDVDMPRMNGFQLLSRIRERDAAMPAILVSGSGNQPSDDSGYEFMAKPIDLIRLRDKIEHAIAS